jgi:hypothetical protein
MIYLYFNHQDRYKQKSEEQGNKCYYTKSFQKKKDQRHPPPPYSSFPPPQLLKDPPKAINTKEFLFF